jgi:ribosome-binding ATPase
MKLGITGLPLSGKTTLFCALTGQHYNMLSHGKEYHIGTVKVPDMRLEKLYDMFKPKKITHATIEYFDIAGQVPVKDAHNDSSPLQILKNADSLIVVLDGFSEKADPRRDFKTLMDEFALNDLIVATGRLDRMDKDLRTGKKEVYESERVILMKCKEVLESGGMVRDIALDDDEGKVIRGFQFLTKKPAVIIINISEEMLTSGKAAECEQQFADIKNTSCAAVCAEIEKEISLLDEIDRPIFLESMGISEPARDRIIHLSYQSLGLISFFTAGGTDEVRAWTIRRGAKAPEAAGTIHSDLERGFIRAETIFFEDLMNVGSYKAAREKGLLRIEGKDYIVKDGDIITIRFNV